MSPDVVAGKDVAGVPTESTTVSIEELTSLKISMETRMDTLNELLTKLLEAQGASLPVTTLPLTPPPRMCQVKRQKRILGRIHLKLKSPQLNHLMGLVSMQGFPFQIHLAYLLLILPST